MSTINGLNNTNTLNSAAHSSLMIAEHSSAAVDAELGDLPEMTPITTARKNALRRSWERGQATAEYVVGVLAAVALALVLLKIVTGNDFFTAALKFVINMIAKAGAMI